MTEPLALWRILSGLLVIGAELLLLLATILIIILSIRIVVNRIQAMSSSDKIKQSSSVLGRRLSQIVWGVGVLVALIIVAFNGILIVRGEDLRTITTKKLAQLPPGFWVQGALGLITLGVLTFFVRVITKPVKNQLQRWEQLAKEYEGITANDESINAFFGLLWRLLISGIWLLILVMVSRILTLPSSVDYYLAILLRVYAILAIGLLAIQAVTAIIDSLNALVVKYSTQYSTQYIFLKYYHRFQELVPLLRRSLEYIIYVVLATLILSQDTRIAVLARFGPPIIQIISIFFLSRVAVEVASLLVDHLMLSGDLSKLTKTQRQQRETLAPVMRSILKYGVYFVAFILILSAINLNPTPFLAGAGIAGLILGLSAQSLLNDIVSGFFILFENLYLVGDYIETGPAKGVVEAIDIRTTRIRDNNGQQYILRNGQIDEIVNFSKIYTYAAVYVGVAYESDLDHVYSVLTELGKKLYESHTDVVAPTEVKGLEGFGASELTIKTVTKVKPGKHLQVARDYRKMIKEAFDREGIEIPFSQHVVSFKNRPDTLRISSVALGEEGIDV